jgi:hypothetical protein
VTINPRSTARCRADCGNACRYTDIGRLSRLAAQIAAIHVGIPTSVAFRVWSGVSRFARGRTSRGKSMWYTDIEWRFSRGRAGRMGRGNLCRYTDIERRFA